MFADSAVAFEFDSEDEENGAEEDENDDFDDLVDFSALAFVSEVFLNPVSVLRIGPDKSLSEQLIEGADHVLTKLRIVGDLINKGGRSEDF
jgi:hypothetical protein